MLSTLTCSCRNANSTLSLPLSRTHDLVGMRLDGCHFLNDCFLLHVVSRTLLEPSSYAVTNGSARVPFRTRPTFSEWVKSWFRSLMEPVRDEGHSANRPAADAGCAAASSRPARR